MDTWRTMMLLFFLSVPSAGSGATSSSMAAQTRHHSAQRAAQALIAEISVEVAALRGLPMKQALRVEVETDKGLSEFVQRSLRANQGVKFWAKQTTMMRLVGLVPPKVGLYEAALLLLRQQVAGLYDPATGLLKVMAKMVPGKPSLRSPSSWFRRNRRMFRTVMAHEIVHALQDQHWNLKKLARDRRGQTDLETALSSLFEGDATLAGLLWEMRDRGQKTSLKGLAETRKSLKRVLEVSVGLARLGLLPGAAGLAKAPIFLRQRLMRPYLDGLNLCLSQIGPDTGFAGIDALYRKPPLSMEQVLHPHKLGRDFPVRLRIPRLTARVGGHVKLEDTLGELFIGAVLRQGLPEAQALAAADGWGGDRMFLLGPKQAERMLWMTTWDSPRDAAEFCAAVRIVRAKWPRPAEVVCVAKDVWVLVGWPHGRAQSLVKVLHPQSRRSVAKEIW